MQRIDHILISHMHGDHFFGVVGLISTMSLLGREKPLHIYNPGNLEEIVDIQLNNGENWINFPLIFHRFTPNTGKIIIDEPQFSVSLIELRHRIPTSGFLIKEKKQPRGMVKEAIQEFDIPFSAIKKIKEGEDFVKEDGTVIPNRHLTLDPPNPRSYAYVSDTAYYEPVIAAAKGVNLMYHESTFTKDMADRAAKTLHSTAEQAATIAKKAAVEKLIIGHFSVRYKELNPLLKEAQAIFPETRLAEEGVTFSVT